MGSMEFDNYNRPRHWPAVLLAVLITAVVLVVGFFAYVRYQHWQTDEINHHAVIAIINYNVQHGALQMPPELAGPPVVATPSPAPKPSATPSTSPSPTPAAPTPAKK